MRHVDGRAKQPIPFTLDASQIPLNAAGKPATDAELEALDNKLDEFCQKDSSVKQYIFLTISDRLLLRVQSLQTAPKIWAEIQKIHEGRTELVQVDLHHQFQEMHCEEGGDVHIHFSELMRM